MSRPCACSSSARTPFGGSGLQAVELSHAGADLLFQLHHVIYAGHHLIVYGHYRHLGFIEGAAYYFCFVGLRSLATGKDRKARTALQRSFS